MSTLHQEHHFESAICEHLGRHGWLYSEGDAAHYDRQTALFLPDLLAWVEATQPASWQALAKAHGAGLPRVLAERVRKCLNEHGTLEVLRRGVELVGLKKPLMLVQFKPALGLNPAIQQAYAANRLRVVRQVRHSLNNPQDAVDLVLFVNGIAVATAELKSDFTQRVGDAVDQYRFDRDPAPKGGLVEPLLNFPGGALVHFAVSQSEVMMSTRLAGTATTFLPFNQGNVGGAGNPPNPFGFATWYLWQAVWQRDSWLEILGRYLVGERDDKKQLTGVVFPRYHQLDATRKLVADVLEHGVGERYLIQHSAGSGKTKSIAWTAHFLADLHDASHRKLFDSVLVVSDRTVLDDQLQETIFDFQRTTGVVATITDEHGSKSAQLSQALKDGKKIIVCTIQTFPFALKAVQELAATEGKRFAVIADEAHSSQTGEAAAKLKQVLSADELDALQDGGEIDTEALLAAQMSAKAAQDKGLTYIAFTATPKQKTLELFGRQDADGLPQPFHVYSMRQAIEEGFILDVLKNYTNYKVAYKLALKIQEADQEVDSKRARVKLNQWVRLHDHNIAQKVKLIVEHFRDNVLGLLGGQAKAMVVTSSRKEAVRYKQCFDAYIADKGYRKIHAIVAFSGEVVFSDRDPNAAELVGKPFTEHNLNPQLKGRDMRKAFDSDDYQVMIVANKFQTGFDQPKLCAMYVDKKLAGVECVQTLSRLNRTYPNKAETGTFVLDFFNAPEDILGAFQPYYQTAELADVSDPNLIFSLYDKLRAAGIFTWQEVEQFCAAFYVKNKSNAAIANLCKPAVQRWQQRYKSAVEAFKQARVMFERTKKTGDVVLITNAENCLKDCQKEKDALEIFKKDLGSFVRFYDFMSQIVDYDDTSLEKLSLYARNLRPMLREALLDEDDIDLDNVVLSHYRVAKIRQQDLLLKQDGAEYKLEPGEGMGTARPRDKKEEFLSQIISRLNEIFVADQLTDKDMVNYAYTIRDKIGENRTVMQQIANNSPEQALLGDFAKAIDDAIMDSSAAHQNQMLQLLADPQKAAGFARVVFDLLVSGNATPAR